MSEFPDYAPSYGSIVAEATADARASFIRRTYGHLAGAVLAFIGIEALLLQIVSPDLIMSMISSQMSWIVILVMFIAVSWIADRWAHSETSKGMQYAGLSLFIVAEAIIFLPLLFIATTFAPDAIPMAGIMTLGVFGGLTGVIFVTGKDYSHIGPILTMGSFLALAFIIAAVIFGFSNFVFLLFCFFMVALASGYIIYQTSQIMHHYRTDQHVAASLGLFSSVALLFWYILQIFLLSRD